MAGFSGEKDRCGSCCCEKKCKDQQKSCAAGSEKEETVFFTDCFVLLKLDFRYDKQLQQIDGTLSTIEMQREALEGANTNTAVLTTMNDAAKALKKANADLDVDKVHDMMDDIAEQQDVAKEISEAISNPVAFGQVNMPKIHFITIC